MKLITVKFVEHREVSKFLISHVPDFSVKLWSFYTCQNNDQSAPNCWVPRSNFIRFLFLYECVEDIVHTCVRVHTHTVSQTSQRSASESIDMRIFTVEVRLIMVLMFVESPVESILKSKL